MTAATRTSTGTVQRQSYSYAKLKLKGEAVGGSGPTRNATIKRARRESIGKSSGKGSRKGTRASTAKVESRGTKGKGKIDGWTLPPELSVETICKMLEKEQGNTAPPEDDICEGVNFMPDVAFGERTEGMSRIQRSELEIEKWEKVKAVHEKHLPRVVPMINETLRKLKEKRKAMEENEENTRVL